MNSSEKKQYLLNKRIFAHKQLEIDKQKNKLIDFLNNLNRKTDSELKITSEQFPLKKIANPAAYDTPDFPKHLNIRCKTDQELTLVKKKYKDWVSNQKTKNIFFKNKYCLNTNDWIVCSKRDFLENFDVFFDELDVMYTILFFPMNRNFISSFEFEYNVIIYKGFINDKEEITYHT